MLAQVALNLTAPVLLTRAALPALRASGEGLVVVVSLGDGAGRVAVLRRHQGRRRPLPESLRRELHGEGGGVLTVYPGATATPMMDSSQAGAELGFDYETPDQVAAASLTAIAEGQIRVLRGGPQRTAMIAADRQDPTGLDVKLAARKDALAEAVREPFEPVNVAVPYGRVAGEAATVSSRGEAQPALTLGGPRHRACRVGV